MREVHRVITGLVIEFDGLHRSILPILVYETDKRAINLHGRTVTDTQYVKNYKGPGSKSIQDAIHDLLEQDILRKDGNHYRIDYYSGSREVYDGCEKKSEDALSVVVDKYEESDRDSIISTINNYSEVESANKYGIIELDNSNQPRL